jgi:2-polyprenyl-3-methyl-5-hydroxy-6-metoxy-1,4-benzoquinol methylase
MNFDYEDIPVGYYDQVLKEGLEKGRGLQATWHHYKFLTVKNYLKSYNSHLDVPCGPGTLIGNYLDLRSTGIDISEKQIEFAKINYENFSNNFKQADIRNKNDDIYTYDVITVLELIEHFNPVEVKYLVESLYAKLNEQGRLILTTPNYNGIWLILEKIVSIVGPVNYKYQHINRYTKKRVLNQFSNYEVEVIKYINFGIFFSILSTKLGIFLDRLFAKIFFNFFGYSLFIVLKKK